MNLFKLAVNLSGFCVVLQNVLQTISEAKKALGYEPKYPIIIVPGLASSALEAWETDKGNGKRESFRVYLSLSKEFGNGVDSLSLQAHG